MPRTRKRVLLGIFDFFILFAALWLSYAIRLGEAFSPGLQQLGLLVAAPAIALPFLYQLGFYRVVVRYLTETTVWTIMKALALSIPLWLAIVYMTEIRGIEGVPRTIPIIYFIVGTAMLSGSRLLAKRLLGAAVEDVVNQKRILIYGAGPVGRQLAAALKLDPRNIPLGFLDDDPALHGAEVAGLRVHSPDKFAKLIDSLDVQEIIVCSDAVDSTAKSAIFRQLAKTPVRLSFLPSVASGFGGDLVSRVRDIGIGDLLGRPMVPPDSAILSAPIAGKTVLVTGAGGSIGSELCRQIVTLKAKALILFELDEFALYEIERALRPKAGGELIPILGSVTDEQRVRRLFEDHSVDTVFHAAAYKHVPMVELNPIAGIVNNVLGTWTVAKAAYDAGVEYFVLISTDKAVRPTNVMGATKRWAEIIVRCFASRDAEGNGKRRFCSVRFGNVIGSQGSVVPLFKEQIERGGPLTLTDQKMTRYFMSVNEAAELIIQAASLSQKGEIFLLDMGAPVRIYDLAENMIRLAGLSVKDKDNPNGDIEIEIVGSRPGEKLFEELFYDPESVEKTIHPKIMYGKRQPLETSRIREALDELEAAVRKGDAEAARDALFSFIKEG
ncbi:polysaccharide biosynthesis protein [Mesorhizobium sp. 1B3]|uniref:polysaccharide biosynthesis protein n=1 Tax=Mesorhizobium sp. 1B3 TaxID=3243599 RepID=UPI003D95634E